MFTCIISYNNSRAERWYLWIAKIVYGDWCPSSPFSSVHPCHSMPTCIRDNDWKTWIDLLVSVINRDEFSLLNILQNPVITIGMSYICEWLPQNHTPASKLVLRWKLRNRQKNHIFTDSLVYDWWYLWFFAQVSEFVGTPQMDVAFRLVHHTIIR